MALDSDSFRYLFGVTFWRDLWREVDSDDCWGMAARLSYYFLLAFFPFLIFISALIGLLPFTPGLAKRILVEIAILGDFSPTLLP